MNLTDARIVVTGAGGGIGSALARELAGAGAALVLTGRSANPLLRLCRDLEGARHAPLAVAADITRSGGRAILDRAVREHWDEVPDCIVHNAAVMDFGAYESCDPDGIRRLVATNIEAPMLITRQFLPGMVRRGAGCITFVGSILGTLALPYFTSYSASKFALRGFAEALRRELRDSGVQVCYVGPRSVRTPLNGPAVQRLAAATGMTLDAPEYAARRIARAMVRAAPETYIGFPEALFARLNAALPRLVDLAMIGQRRRMSPFAQAQT